MARSSLQSAARPAAAGRSSAFARFSLHRARRWGVRAALLAGFAAIGTAFAMPFYWMAVSSLKPVSQIFSRSTELIPSTVTTEAYVRLFTDYPFLRWYGNTVYMTALHTGLILLVASAAAFALAKYRFWGRTAIFLIILSSLMVPFHLKLIPLFLTLNTYGLLNTYTGIVLPLIANPLAVFFLRQYMLSIDDNLLDAARIDGASEYRLFTTIVLPLSKPALGTLAVLLSLSFWNELLWPLVVARTPALYPLTVGIASLTSTYRPQYHLVMAGSVLSVLPVALLYLFMQKRFMEGLAISSGVKG